MHLLGIISTVLLVTSVATRPQAKEQEPGPAVENDVSSNQKLARPAPPTPPDSLTSPPMAGPAMMDPRIRAAMMMQAAQMEQMVRQGQRNRNGPRQDMRRFGNMAPPPGMPQGMPRPPMMGLPPQFGMGVPGANMVPPPMMGRNMTGLPGQMGLSPEEMMMLQQQQMGMLNELVKRQKGLGQALPSLDDQQEASLPEGLYPEMNPALQQQLMLLQLQQQQQALMALRNGARDRSMPPMEDLRAASMDPRLAMMMNGPPMQTPMPPSMMAPDMLRGAMPTDMRRMPGNDAPGVPEPFQDLRPMTPGQETGRPYRQRIRSFLEKLKAKVAERKAEASPEKRKGGDRARALRARMMMRLAAANGAPNPMMGPGPVMGQSPMMGPSVMGPYPAMGQNPMVQNPMMGRHPMMQNPMMGQHPMAQNPMVGRHPMAQNSMMGPHPVPQNPMIGQNPMMQNPMMGPRPMTPRPPLQRPGMLPPMPQRIPGLPTSPSDPRSLNGQSLRSILSGAPGRVVIPLSSIQHVMKLETQLEEVRRGLVQSFYTDLIKYRMMTEHFKAQMKHKIMLIHQIEAKLATPIRNVLASGRLNLPISPKNQQSSTIITKLKDMVMNKERAENPAEE